MANQCRGGGFAVGAGDGDDGRLLCHRAQFAGEEFDVADHLHTRIARGANHFVRRGMGERNAGTQNQRLQLFPRPGAEGADDRTFLLGGDGCRFALIPGMNARATGFQRADRGKAGSGEPENADIHICEARDRDHRYLNFRVERPMRASTTAMIQKRITMVDSFQPICSK
jgi:hypothetical protein